MQLSVNLFLTLDGVYQAPGGPDEVTGEHFPGGGWVVPHIDEDFGEIVDSWFARTDALLLGRTTYQIMGPHWSQVTDPEDEVAKTLNRSPKYVVTNTLTPRDATWANTTIVEGDVMARIRRLREAPGGELQVHGSGALARSLHDEGLVDVYRLLIFPVVLGQGHRLFDTGTAPHGFAVINHRLTAAGVTYLELRPTDFAAGSITVQDGRDVIE